VLHPCPRAKDNCRGIYENRGVEQAGYRGDSQSLVLGWNRPRDVVKIVGGNHFPNPEDNLIVEESLAIPQLIKFGAIKRRRAGQAFIALHAAGLAIGVLSVELQELHAERSAFPVQKFVGGLLVIAARALSPEETSLGASGFQLEGV
jgi:hypothetical protein